MMMPTALATLTFAMASATHTMGLPPSVASPAVPPTSPDSGWPPTAGRPEDGDRAHALAEALAAATGADAPAHVALQARLQTAAFLDRLDSAVEYQKASRFRLRVVQVLDALAQNRAPSAARAFVALTTSTVFLAHDERVIALVRAGANLRPAPAALVAFWDRRSRPDDGFTPTTIDAVVANGSASALALFERKMIGFAHSDDDKIGWMHTSVLAHRNDALVLKACERLLFNGRMKKTLRPLLIETLFDYRPGEWFRPATVRPVAPLRSATAHALVNLVRIGERALQTLPLDDSRRAAVTRRLDEARQLREGGARPAVPAPGAPPPATVKSPAPPPTPTTPTKTVTP